MNEFRAAHNNHSISTEGNRTPIQLFFHNQHLMQLHEHSRDLHPGISVQELLHENITQVTVHSVGCPLTAQEQNELGEMLDSIGLT